MRDFVLTLLDQRQKVLLEIMREPEEPRRCGQSNEAAALPMEEVVEADRAAMEGRTLSASCIRSCLRGSWGCAKRSSPREGAAYPTLTPLGTTVIVGYRLDNWSIPGQLQDSFHGR